MATTPSSNSLSISSPAGLDRLTLFESFSQILQRVSVELASDDVLNAACQSIVETLPMVDHAGIILFQPPYHAGKVVAEYPLQGGIGQEIVLGDYPAYNRLKLQFKTLVLNDIAAPEVANEIGAENQKTLLSFGVQSVLILPLAVQDRFIGSIGLDVFRQKHVFSTAEIEVMQAVASQIAISIRNAQLFAEAESQVASQAMIERITHRLPLRTDLHTLLATAAGELAKLLNAGQSRIYLKTDATESSLSSSPSDLPEQN